MKPGLESDLEKCKLYQKFYEDHKDLYRQDFNKYVAECIRYVESELIKSMGRENEKKK